MPSLTVPATHRLTGLREQRLAAGIQQADLAAKANIGQSMVSLLETLNRRARPEVIGRLAKALGCTPADLIERSP